MTFYTKLSTKLKVESVLFGLAVMFTVWGVLQIVFLGQKYRNTFYPGVSIDGVVVSGHTPDEVTAFFAARQQNEAAHQFTIVGDTAQISSSAAQLGLQKNYAAAIDQAYQLGRTQPLVPRFWHIVSVNPPTQNVTAETDIDQDKLALMFEALKQKLNVPGEEPQAILGFSQQLGSLSINPGKPGRELDIARTTASFMAAVQTGAASASATIVETSPPLSDAQQQDALTLARKLVGKQLIFRTPDIREKLNDQALINLLAFPTGISQQRLAALKASWQKDIKSSPQNAEFVYDPQTLAVTKFVPPRPGLTIDDQQLTTTLQKYLDVLKNSDQKNVEVELPVIVKNPTIDLAQTNNLGIVQRIGFGESEFHHSIPGRIHNVALTASKINNSIVKPGDEFSFNRTLGDVSAATGFDQAYIIQNGRTVLGDGGGVCQVSSTLFRALLDAGLPITKRHAHSYRVSYYELNSQPGFDATVYGGDVDLRFINDTGHDLLIHTETDTANLYMKIEIYGTSDGRSTQITDYKLWDLTAAPPPRYQDDPTLPPGRIKQVDFAAGGAKVSFKNVIKDKNGNVTREDSYFSDYTPWQAVFLRGV